MSRISLRFKLVANAFIFTIKFPKNPVRFCHFLRLLLSYECGLREADEMSVGDIKRLLLALKE